MLTLIACKAQPQGDNPEITQTIEELTNSDGKLAIAVTDANGEAVTNDKGDYVTELATPVTNANNELVTNEVGQYIVEKENGEQIAVGEPTGTTAPAQQSTAPSGNESGTTGGTTKKESTTKKATTTTTKPTTTAKQTTTTTTTTTTKPTTKKADETTKHTTTSPKYINCKIIIKAQGKVILDAYSINVEKSNTIIKILEQACKENDIAIEKTTSIAGTPSVSSIDGVKGKWYCYKNDNTAAKIYNYFQATLTEGDTVTFTID